ncbi:hypothetical protein ACP70R_001341 [Stipagrostis hirtigluma subsp. patula]
MGCGHSRLPRQQGGDDTAAVALCRARAALLADAIACRYALADAHRAYAASLRAAGAALHDLLRAAQDAAAAAAAAAPAPGPSGAALLLPAQGKGVDGAAQAALPDAGRAGGDDDGDAHIRFLDDDEDDSSDDGAGHIRFPSPSDDGAGHIRFPSDDGGSHIRFPTDDGGSHIRFPSDDGAGHIRFPSDDGAGHIRVPSNDGAGHIRFPSGDELHPPLSRPEPAPLSWPQPEAPAPPLPQPEPLQPATQGWWPQPPPPQMPAPYAPGYAPPYSYGPGPGPAYGYGADMGGYGRSYYSISYARSQPPPHSVSYAVHHPQVANAAVHYYHGGEPAGPPPPGSGHYYHGGEPAGPPPPGSGHYYHGGEPAGLPPPGSYYGGYPYQYRQDGGLPPMAASAGERAAPMPPPSPPQVSTWDFLNPFESFESYYHEQPPAVPTHTASRSSSDVFGEDDEDIPELEDEELADVVMGVDANEFTFVNGKLAKEEEERKISGSEELNRKSKSSDAGSTTTVSEELHRKSKSSDASSTDGSSILHVVEKSVLEEHSGVAESPAVPKKIYSDDVEVVQEIKSQFNRASESAGDVCKVLEVGKMPYHQKNSGLKVSSMMICGLPSMDEEFLQFEKEKAMECGDLSSTLQKLYMWEKKLLEEVKIEEKIRVQYDKKRQELKNLDRKGAEAHKLEAVEICIRKLSTKISVAIQVVNTISARINKLRDEELWPQICELIQGFAQMWHTMSDCHQIQCHAWSQAINIDSTIAAARFSEAQIDLVKQLELQLLDSTASFAAWINAQKSYISTLNEWLKKGIEYVPEVTDDGVPPFSPGRLGAPPIFSICNNWAISLERISEKEVVDTMQAFASNVLQLWERHSSDLDRDLKSTERDEESIRKALAVQNKKLVLISNQSGVSLSAQVVHAKDPPSEAGLQSCMDKFFEAMESFAAACANAHKDLQRRSEEEKARLAAESG